MTVSKGEKTALACDTDAFRCDICTFPKYDTTTLLLHRRVITLIYVKFLAFACKEPPINCLLLSLPCAWLADRSNTSSEIDQLAFASCIAFCLR